jgi:hypothetical protein
MVPLALVLLHGKIASVADTRTSAVVDPFGRAGRVSDGWRPIAAEQYPASRARRRLSGVARLCPGGSAFTRTPDLLVASSGEVEFIDDAGYAGFLFCEWEIAPPAATRLTLLFEHVDVACCGRDVLQVFSQLGTNESTRARLLSHPASFDDVGRMPTPITAERGGAPGVRLLVRLTSGAPSGAAGFHARYTSEAFSLLSVTPRLLPASLDGSLLTLSGAGLGRATCTLLLTDAAVVAANPGVFEGEVAATPAVGEPPPPGTAFQPAARWNASAGCAFVDGVMDRTVPHLLPGRHELQLCARGSRTHGADLLFCARSQLHHLRGIQSPNAALGTLTVCARSQVVLLAAARGDRARVRVPGRRGRAWLLVRRHGVRRSAELRPPGHLIILHCHPP